MSLLVRCAASRALARQAIMSCGSARLSPAVCSAISPISPATSSAIVLSKRESSSGNFTPLWTAERALSAGLVGIVPAALVMPNPATEFLLALSLTAHIHWGMEAIAVDYVRARIVGEALPKVAMGAVYALSFATLGGLMYFNFTDVGLAHAVRMLWTL